MKFRVLVFPCGSEIGLEIHQALRYSAHIELFGASSVPDHGRFVYERYTGSIPFSTQKGFGTALKDIVDREKIDFIIPAHDEAVLALAENAQLLGRPIIGSPLATCQICRSKKKTYELFAGKLPVPKMFALSDNLQFPIFLKPDAGYGSRGVVRAATLREAEFYCSNNPALIPMEYLPGKEYTIDCFTDRHGVLRFADARGRIRVSNGISVSSRTVEGEEFQSFAQIINAGLSLRGAWFFQMKQNASGQPVLMEIAPRIAGSSGLHRVMGVNLPLLSIYDAAGLDVEVVTNTANFEFDRALGSRFKTDLRFCHVYVDWDDCLWINESMNLMLLAFLYQCVGKKIKVHLLTRHKGEMANELERCRVSGLFDSVTLLSAGQKKSSLIAEKDAIFIDDSFAERNDVSKNCGIPVFGPEMVEALIQGAL
jgi:hypothetical protein